MEKDNEELKFLKQVNNGDKFVVGKTYEVLLASISCNFQVGDLITCKEINSNDMIFAKFALNADYLSSGYLYYDDKVREVDPIKEEEVVASTSFQKFDLGKTRLSLIEPNFIEGVGKVLTFGAEKYAANGWQNLPKEELYRYKDAMLRHIMAYLKGEYADPESGIPHLDHAATNIMFLKYFEEQKPKG